MTWLYAFGSAGRRTRDLPTQCEEGQYQRVITCFVLQGEHVMGLCIMELIGYWEKTYCEHVLGGTLYFPSALFGPVAEGGLFALIRVGKGDM